MFSKNATKKSIGDCSGQVERLGRALSEAEAVVIGAGAGLSTSAGFTYSGERFEKNFADFAGKYGFSGLYAGGFCPFPTREEFRAFGAGISSQTVISSPRSQCLKPCFA